MARRPADDARKGTIMARGLNRVQIIGNLGADPEMRTIPSGSAVTNFRVAVSRNRRGADGTMVDETEWFRVVAFDSGGYKLAEICNQYLRKGQKVYVEGRLQSRKYTDKDGIERTSVEIIASEMIMLSGRDEDETGGSGMASPQRAAVASGARRAPAGDDDYGDDTPF
jgi:single-strand DNA-binding protein